MTDDEQRGESSSSERSPRWWSRQKHIAEQCLEEFRSPGAGLSRFADDLISLADVFDSQGPETMHEFEAALVVPAVDWAAEFRSAALTIEVVYSVALDSNWDKLPPDQVVAVDQAVEELQQLLSGIPSS
ncbi:hypothetical protein [Streptacidiphilus carbonis]|uniref:hypothetical protein n=1 Tax=Streptacidiphilus carbonis TaxID=105422 RepID=UPI001269C73E|nr:hypothetical protein [Streptacidiphilus carbonis]